MKLSIILSILIFLFPLFASAHGGGLDALGGHHNRKLGGYHFHRGALAGKSFGSKAEAQKALNKYYAEKEKRNKKSNKKIDKKP